MADVEYPVEYKGVKTLPLVGSSLMPIFQGEHRPTSEHLISGFTDKFRMYRSGDWKLVRQNGDQWELYNMKDDPTEMKDLATSNPNMLNIMKDKYRGYQDSKKNEMNQQ